MLRCLLPGLLLLVTASATWAQSDSEPRYTPRRVLREATAIQLKDEFGAEPYALLRAWTRGEDLPELERFMGFRGWPSRLDAARRELLLCALWSEDLDVAFAAACEMPERLMDVRDTDRYVTVTLPHLFDEDLRFDWQVFKHVLSTAQVTQVLNTAPRWKSDARYMYIQDLHRSMRSVHVPQLCALARHDDPIVRKQAMSTLGNLLCYRDDHRDQVAELLLTWPGDHLLSLIDNEDPQANPRFMPRDRALPAAREGWSPRFRMLVDDLLLNAEDTRESMGFRVWLSRWADDEVAANEDIKQLLALLATEDPVARRVALCSIEPVASDPRVDAALRAFERNPDTSPEERAASFLARGARDEWRARQLDDDSALLAALAAEDDVAWERFAARAFGADADAGLTAIRLLVDARDTSRFAPIDWPESAHERIREAIQSSAPRLDPQRLIRLAEEFPCCRTTSLAKALLAVPAPEELGPSLAAMLEVHDEDALRRSLLRAHESGQAEATELLARLGAPELHDALVVWAAEDPWRFELLGRSGGSGAVRNQLLMLAGMADGERVTTDQAGGFVALAESAGLPPDVAQIVGYRLPGVPAEIRAQHVDRWVEQLANREVVDFLLSFLRVTDPHLSWPMIHPLGSVDDPRMRTYLRGRITEFAVDDVQDAILELAIAGDAEARAEVDEVLGRHLYGWIDDAHEDANNMRGDLSLADYWVGEVGTVCCRRNGAAGALDDLFGYVVYTVSETAPRTQEDHARDFWRRNREHLRFSRLLGRHVVAPR